MSAPVKHTCPDIDRIIKWVNAAINEAEEGMKMDDELDIKATFKEIIYHLDGIESGLEDLRRSNSSLREWGEELEEQLKEKDDIINDLEDQLIHK